MPVQVAAGQAHETVHLVDWEHPDRNDFALAEKVTLKGGHERRPDIVLYLNGIAVVVHETLHLIAPTHSDRFLELLTRHYPSWREARAELNELLLAAEAWKDLPG